MSYFPEGITFPNESEKDINTWADFCELFCLLSEDKSQTIDQLCDRLLDQCSSDYKRASKHLALTGTVSGGYILEMMAATLEDEAAETTAHEDVDVDELDDLPSSDDSKYNDRLNAELRFLFDFLYSRAELYGEKYPFAIATNSISLIPVRSIHQNVYLSLMLSALLRIYTPINRNRLGHLFEDLCGIVFKKLVPLGATTHPFGAGAGPRAGTPFTGTFYHKVIKLGELLNTMITDEFKRNEHDHNHVGDGGLDWVSWHSFSDARKGTPLFFGQCACGDDWVDKEMDAHEDKWNNHLQFNDRYLLYHFISKSFRKSDGSWMKPGKINFGIILIDRFRILENIAIEETDIIMNLYSELLVEALSVNMPLVDI